MKIATVIIIIVAMFAVGTFVTVVAYQWCAINIFPGAVDAGLIVGSLSWGKAFILMIIVILFSGSSSARRML